MLRAPSYEQLQSSTIERWDWLKQVEQYFHALPRDSGYQQISDLVTFMRTLGEGQYSKVYLAVLKEVPNGFSIALKRMFIDRSREPVLVDKLKVQLLREEIAYCYLNSLVLLNIVPSFPLMYAAFLRRNPTRYTYTIMMECGDGNMNDWLKLPELTECDVLGGIFQVVVACLAMGSHMQIVNNDLYLKNILWNRIVPTQFGYKLDNCYWSLHCHFLLKITDFGICSSPTFLSRDHDDNPFFRSLQPIETYTNFDFAKHILQYDVPPYARDLLPFLYSMQRRCPKHMSRVKKWLTFALKFLQRAAVNGWMDSPEGMTRYVKTVFAPEFLSKYGMNIPLEWLWGEPPTQQFDLAPKASSIRSIKWMARGRLRAKGVIP